jgi:hypothetical protein
MYALAGYGYCINIPNGFMVIEDSYAVKVLLPSRCFFCEIWAKDILD